MTLKDIIEQYKREDYDFFKYKDKDGKDIQTHFIFESHSDYLDKYLGFYKDLPNLTEVIVFAADGVFKLTNRGFEYFIRHNHQEVFLDRNGNNRGIPVEISRQVRNNLIVRINEILKVRNFDEIYQIVSECKVKGFGELAIYDTSMRIASYMNIEPDKVYLHAGARAGFEALEEKGYIENGASKKKFIELKELPSEFKELKAAEIEHLACSKKDELKQMGNKQ